jgi:hypothetical protein
MEERGEVPDGMSGIIRYESLLASALWHSASPKKAPDVRISALGWEPNPETAL